MTTLIDDTEQKRTRLQKLASGYAMGAFFGVVAFCILIIPATPLFIRLFLPFPKLEDASHWTGTIEIEGKTTLSRRGWAPAKQYIVTSTGRKEFKCGYLGYREPCFSGESKMQGAVGDVWFHPIFGAIQWRLVLQQEPFKGRVEESPIRAEQNYWERHFGYGRYVEKLLPAIAALLASAWSFRKSRKLRQLSEAG